MDGTKLQAKIYIGYGKAAKRIGFDYQQFRATSASNPLSSTALQTLPASFTTNFSYSAPNKYGQATWLGLFDARLCQPGDFLVGQQGTFLHRRHAGHAADLLRADESRCECAA